MRVRSTRNKVRVRAIELSFAAKRLAATIFWAAVLGSSSAISQETSENPPHLTCDVGPANKTYGMTEWLVYSCNDRRSVVIVSAPGNPAFPYYFILSLNENGYLIEGEGTGSKDATSAALEEIRLLSPNDIVALIYETMQP